MSFVHTLRFVKKAHHNSNIYTFYFSKPQGIRHKAGQHAVFIQPHLTRPHVFSLSSAPEEEFLTITTHVRQESRYKKRLEQMKSGDKLLMIGPLLNFIFRDGVSNYTLLAQGIGITPFRSMLVHAHEVALPVTIALIHVQNDSHTFRDLTEKYATSAAYPTTPEEFRGLVASQNSESTFYLSGSPKFVLATIKLLRNQGVKSTHIHRDYFLGY